MTLAQILFSEFKTREEVEHEKPTTKKPRTDSPRQPLPKLKNMSRCKAWKEEYD